METLCKELDDDYDDDETGNRYYYNISIIPKENKLDEYNKNYRFQSKRVPSRNIILLLPTAQEVLPQYETQSDIKRVVLHYGNWKPYKKFGIVLGYGGQIRDLNAYLKYLEDKDRIK